jgi:hypothetical protein
LAFAIVAYRLVLPGCRVFAACSPPAGLVVVVRNDLGTVGADHLKDEDARSGADRMSARTAARLGWFLFVASVLLFVSALVLNLRRPQYADLVFTTGDPLRTAPTYATPSARSHSHVRAVPVKPATRIRTAPASVHGASRRTALAFLLSLDVTV